jgi:hypothetical protein
VGKPPLDSLRGSVLNAPGRPFGALRNRIAGFLQSDRPATCLSEWSEVPVQRLINPLLSFLYSTDVQVKWRAVTAVGVVVARIADEDLEAARTIMRRLMWSLNDESGGIGWGAAEAMGEIMARQACLAEEYHRILVSYIRDDGNRLDHEALETAVLWGIGRLAQARPELLSNAAGHLFPYLQSGNSLQRGLAAWALGFLGATVPVTLLGSLLEDRLEIIIYEEGKFNRYRLSELAARLLV